MCSEKFNLLPMGKPGYIKMKTSYAYCCIMYGFTYDLFSKYFNA